MLDSSAENCFLTVLSVLKSHCFEWFKMTRNIFSFGNSANMVHSQSSMYLNYIANQNLISSLYSDHNLGSFQVFVV